MQHFHLGTLALLFITFLSFQPSLLLIVSFFQDTRAKAALVRRSTSLNCFFLDTFLPWLPLWLPELLPPLFHFSRCASSLSSPSLHSQRRPPLVCCTIVARKSRSAFVYIISVAAAASGKPSPLSYGILPPFVPTSLILLFFFLWNVKGR